MIQRIKQIGVGLFVLIVISLVIYVNAQSEPLRELETLDTSIFEKIAVDVNEEAQNGIVLEQIDWDKKNTPPKEDVTHNPITSKIEVATNEPVQVTQVVAQSSSVRDRSFRMNNGTYMTGSQIIDEAMGNANARKLWDQFNLHFGGEVANKAIISMKFENGTYDSQTVGVCSPLYQTNGDYRRCVFADMNTAGMDAGLKQINTFYQRYRIAKLGGPSCEPMNSRDITDPCTAAQVEWLKNVDNNIHIAVNIYAESGFQPWYGAQRAGIV